MADYISKFEAEEIDELLQKVKDGSSGGGGSGSGIIDVPELPTVGIDENAIYKVVVNEENIPYIVTNGTYYTVEQFAISTFGVSDVQFHWVNELPDDMLKYNLGDSVIHIYFINPTGVGYCYFATISMVLTLGYAAFSNFTSDKGYTADITLETEDGVYVQEGQHSEDWFYRENGEWVRITPEQERKQITLTKPIATGVFPDEGKVFNAVAIAIGFKSIGDFIDRDITIEKISENDLARTDGTNVFYLRGYAFAGAKVRSITLPSSITWYDNDAFYNAEVEELTFKGKPIALGNNIFATCPNLKTLNVSWQNYEVSGAPWGATNATINYNYTGE